MTPEERREITHLFALGSRKYRRAQLKKLARKAATAPRQSPPWSLKDENRAIPRDLPLD